MTERYFDLNIEEMLQAWEVEHALREVIANALDEQVLTGTGEIEIFKDASGVWHIRDFGRGLRIEHFTLKENPEKLNAEVGVIGTFGVGLKDALATFYRRGIEVGIRSSHGLYYLSTAEKHNFNAIETLHVVYDDTPTGLQGTEFILPGVTDAAMARAKSRFLHFVGEEVVETTPYGAILARQPLGGRVYIQGMLANEEPNFLFSYNVTDLTPAMRKRLNRERLTVERTIYAPRIRSILRSAESKAVHDLLVKDVRRPQGLQHDELGWIEISQMALTLMPKQKRVVYFTDDELERRDDVVTTALSEGFEPVTITEQQKEKLDAPPGRVALDPEPEAAQAVEAVPQPETPRTVVRYIKDYQRRFAYDFVDPASLAPEERAVHVLLPEIVISVGLDPASLPEIRIAEALPLSVHRPHIEGTWDPGLRTIVLKRSALTSPAHFASVLLYEVARVASQTTYGTPAFERTLLDYLGRAAAKAARRS